MVVINVLPVIPVPTRTIPTFGFDPLVYVSVVPVIAPTNDTVLLDVIYVLGETPVPVNTIPGINCPVMVPSGVNVLPDAVFAPLLIRPYDAVAGVPVVIGVVAYVQLVEDPGPERPKFVVTNIPTLIAVFGPGKYSVDEPEAIAIVVFGSATAADEVPKFDSPPPIKFKNPCAIFKCPPTTELVENPTLLYKPPPMKPQVGEPVIELFWPPTIALKLEPLAKLANPPPTKQ